MRMIMEFALTKYAPRKILFARCMSERKMFRFLHICGCELCEA